MVLGTAGEVTPGLLDGVPGSAGLTMTGDGAAAGVSSGVAGTPGHL